MTTTQLRLQLPATLYPFRMSHRIDQSAIRSRVRRLIAEKADGRQQDFATLTDIQPSMMSRLLAGHELFTRRYLLKIEKATSARLPWLEYGIEPLYYEEGKAPDRPEMAHYEGGLLRAYLDKQGIEYADFARQMGKSKNTVQGYFKTESLSKTNKATILTTLNATQDDVFGYGSDRLTPPPADTNHSSRIKPISVGDLMRSPVLRIPISARAGFGYQSFFGDQSPEREYIPVSDDRLYPGIPHDRHAVIEVNGDSMEPVLEHGYEVLAYRMTEGQFPSLNKIVLIDFRDELTIKRLTGIDYVAETVVLKSENGGAELRVPMSEIRSVWHVYDYYKARL